MAIEYTGGGVMGETISTLFFLAVIAELFWFVLYIDIQISRLANKSERAFAKTWFDRASSENRGTLIKFFAKVIYASYVWPYQSLVYFLVVFAITISVWRTI